MTDFDRNFLLWLTSDLHGLFDALPMKDEHRRIRQGHLKRAYEILEKVVPINTQENDHA